MNPTQSKPSVPPTGTAGNAGPKKLPPIPPNSTQLSNVRSVSFLTPNTEHFTVSKGVSPKLIQHLLAKSAERESESDPSVSQSHSHSISHSLSASGERSEVGTMHAVKPTAKYSPTRDVPTNANTSPNSARVSTDEAFATLFQRQQSVKQFTQQLEENQLQLQQQQRTPSRLIRRQDNSSSPSIMVQTNSRPSFTHQTSTKSSTPVKDNNNYSPYRGNLQQANNTQTTPTFTTSESFRRNESINRSFNTFNNPKPLANHVHVTSSAPPRTGTVKMLPKPLPEVSHRAPSSSVSSVKLEVIDSTDRNSLPNPHPVNTPTVPQSAPSTGRPAGGDIPSILVEPRNDSARSKPKEKDEHVPTSIAPVNTTLGSLLSSAKNTPKSTPKTTPCSTPFSSRPTTPTASSALITTASSTTANATTNTNNSTPADSREGSPALASLKRNALSSSNSNLLHSSGSGTPTLRDSNGGNFITNSSGNERCSTPKRRRSRHSKRSSADKDEKEDREKDRPQSRNRSKDHEEKRGSRERGNEGFVRRKRLVQSLSSEELGVKMPKPARKGKRRSSTYNDQVSPSKRTEDEEMQAKKRKKNKSKKDKSSRRGMEQSDSPSTLTRREDSREVAATLAKIEREKAVFRVESMRQSPVKKDALEINHPHLQPINHELSIMESSLKFYGTLYEKQDLELKEVSAFIARTKKKKKEQAQLPFKDRWT